MQRRRTHGTPRHPIFHRIPNKLQKKSTSRSNSHLRARFATTLYQRRPHIRSHSRKKHYPPRSRQAFFASSPRRTRTKQRHHRFAKRRMPFATSTPRLPEAPYRHSKNQRVEKPILINHKTTRNIPLCHTYFIPIKQEIMKFYRYRKLRFINSYL